MTSDSRRNNSDVTTPSDDSDTTTSEAAVGSVVNEDLRSALREDVVLLKEMPLTTTKAGGW
jgi:hypothetical protein